MTVNLLNNIEKLFEQHRIVFWYDAQKELRAEFEALHLPEVTKLEIANNEYALKYRVLRQEPEQKFLLYHEGPQPQDLDNWLLDMLLAGGELRADQLGLWLAELELGLEFADLLHDYTAFFRNAKRREALKKRLEARDSRKKIELKMLTVCTGAEPRLDAIVERLLEELAKGEESKIQLIASCGLANFLWEQMQAVYGYASSTPGMNDFAITLFKYAYSAGTGGECTTPLKSDAIVLLKHWKDNRLTQQAFEKLSATMASVLDIEQTLHQADYRHLMDVDYFSVIDLKIVHDLKEAIVGGTLNATDVSEYIRQRRQSVWFEKWKNLYETLDFAAHFFQALEQTVLEMADAANAVERYAQGWFKIDQLYRKVMFHARKASQSTVLGSLVDKVENLYSNKFLLTLGDRFQAVLGALPRWEVYPVPRQNEFFTRFVEPFLKRDNKVCVIVSDAMRYEIGEELHRLIRQEDKFGASIQPMLTMLPSYTQLGMAALLPHKQLAIAENETGTALVDGQNSAGTENRNKILQTSLAGRGAAIQAEELMVLGRDPLRDLLKNNDVVYVYHNRIDAAGDNAKSEDTVFEAAENAIAELINIIKRLTGNNVSNILLTADHGFLYQESKVNESDFTAVNIEGRNVFVKNRRFVLGRGLVNNPALYTAPPHWLGLAGEVEALLPLSITRLRVQGAGSRYVHGGAALQEVVVPVLQVNKKRQSDTDYVSVSILSESSSVITTNQFAVKLYQQEPVSEKMYERKLKASICTEAGEVISDMHELSFNSSSSQVRERETTVRFLLTAKADKANGKEVLLKLEEKVPGTSHYKEYASRRYILRRSFTSDFDF